MTINDYVQASALAMLGERGTESEDDLGRNWQQRLADIDLSAHPGLSQRIEDPCRKAIAAGSPWVSTPSWTALRPALSAWADRPGPGGNRSSLPHRPFLSHSLRCPPRQPGLGSIVGPLTLDRKGPPRAEAEVEPE